MLNKDFHMHTTFSDGIHTPEEMIQEGIRLGMEEIGISDHSYTSFDTSYCMKKEQEEVYKKELLSLKEKYKNQILVKIGIEQDYYSDAPAVGYDYIIGSVHYLLVEGEYIPVDESPEILRAAAEKYFVGDVLSLAEVYYDTVADVVDKTDADIIGHFDLITKFIEKEALFSLEDERYVQAWQKAADRLLEKGKPFEINHGAIHRGYRSTPYPAKEIQKYILDRGGKLIPSSDAHSKEMLRR